MPLCFALIEALFPETDVSPTVSDELKWAAWMDGLMQGGRGDNWKKYSLMTLEMDKRSPEAMKWWFSELQTKLLHAEVERERERNERPDVSGSQLTGLACVMLPVKVNVYG